MHIQLRPPRGAERGAALVTLLLGAFAFGLLVLPFLNGPSQAADWESPDPKRKVQLDEDEDEGSTKVDRIFADDVAIFDEDMGLEESLADWIATSVEEQFAFPVPFIGPDGLIDQDRLDNGRKDYELNCAGCHGLQGDGAGPAARYLDPRPRNFRKGFFKFTTTGGGRPRVQDLMHTLQRGLTGSSMPSFRLLPEGRRRSIVEYVRLLSMRGEFEERGRAERGAFRDGDETRTVVGKAPGYAGERVAEEHV